MPLEIKKASRQSVRPLISFYGESGCGKTYSALLAARGFVGSSGRIIIADTESGRGSLYADVISGGYDCIDVAGPYSPERAIEAIDLVEKSGASIGVLDSASHFWEGIGGVLDQATANEQRSGKPGLHNWRTPKLAHQKMMLRLLQASIPWIVCLRAKYKTRQVKDVHGKTQIIRDEATSPIQSDEFLFEMTAHAEILPDHSIHLTKCSHPDLRKCFPEKGPITIQHGELIAKWCAAPSGPVGNPTSDPRKALMRELWELAIKVRGPEKDWKAFEKWALERAVIGDTETVTSMTEERLRELLEALKKVL